MEEHGAPKRLSPVTVADLVHRRIERAARPRVERKRELERRVVVQVRDRDADERQAPLADDRIERGEEPSGDCQDARGLRGRVRGGLR